MPRSRPAPSQAPAEPGPEPDFQPDCQANAEAPAKTDTIAEAERDEEINALNFRQARTALDLVLAQLQASDLEVEAMATLVRQAQRYADRCEAVLRQVEQDVMQWDAQDPESDPLPLSR